MKKLKKNIILIFVATLVLLSFAESCVDVLFEKVAMPYYGLKGVTETLTATAIYITVSLILIAIATYSFARVIGKKFETEMCRQMAERNMLYANIAYDLKTPMTSILGYAKALSDKKVEWEQTEFVVDRIYKKAVQTDELLNMLFEYTKLQTGSYPLNMAQADICGIVRRVVAGQYEAFEDKNIQLEIDIPDKRISVICDVRQIERAVGNLIINAYKHNAAGTLVGILVRENVDTIFIMIADNGIDVAAEDMEKIFEPFVSDGISDNTVYGNGLGLAIAKRIVEKHGGTLSVEHKESKYVKEFVICLKTDNGQTEKRS